MLTAPGLALAMPVGYLEVSLCKLCPTGQIKADSGASSPLSSLSVRRDLNFLRRQCKENSEEAEIDDIRGLLKLPLLLIFV